MIVRLRSWYAGRSVRERRLLVALAVIALPVLAWLLVVRPLENAYQKALERHLEAVDRHGRVNALTEALKARPAKSRVDPAVDIQFVVGEVARLAGVTVSELSPMGADRAAVTITNARAPAAAEWIRSIEARGLAVEELRMTPTAERGVDVSARLARR